MLDSPIKSSLCSVAIHIFNVYNFDFNGSSYIKYLRVLGPMSLSRDAWMISGLPRMFRLSWKSLQTNEKSFNYKSKLVHGSVRK